MKRLIYTDQNAISQLRQTLQKKVVYFNYFLAQYHTFQKFHRVSTIEEAIELVNSPIKAFDKAVITSSNMPTLGGLSADINAVCVIYNVDRPGYLQAIQDAKEKYSFSAADAIKFEAGVFTIDEGRYSQACDKFNIYATTPAQIELVNHFETLVNTLNRHMKQDLLSSSNIPEISKACGLLYNVFTPEPFEVDYKRVSDLIVNLK